MTSLSKAVLIKGGDATLLKADCTVLPSWQGDWAAALPKSLLEVTKAAHRDFKGSLGETFLLYTKEGKRLLLLGLGKEAEATRDSLRRAYSQPLKKLAKESKSVAFFIPAATEQLPRVEIVRGVLEGLLLSDYSFCHYLKRERLLSEVVVDSLSQAELKEAEEIRHLIEGVNLARDLVNENADETTPAKLAQIVRGFKKLSPRLKVDVLEKKKLEKLGMGLLLAVGRASRVPPVLVRATYLGAPKEKRHIALVGKGITYDTGGLNLKTDMLTMKCDMAGAAACIGLLYAVLKNRMKCNLTIVIPATENAIDSSSYKPGDVYRSFLGKTVEIGNTDAEGRLVLADALAWTEKVVKPTAMVDMATLTGAMVVALGHEATGFFSSDAELAAEIINAGEETGDLLVQFPLISDLKEKLKSDIADLKNVAGRDAGAVKAALFLREFVGKTPWAHLDIAGTAFRPDSSGWNPKNATGVGVRLLYELMK